MGEWNRNTYNGQGKMWWFPSYEALETNDDSNAPTYNGRWINNKHHGSGEYYWPDKKQTFIGTNTIKYSFFWKLYFRVRY